MPLDVTKLKECPQALWLGDRNLGYSSGGICYYMSEYVRTKIWADAKSFGEARKAAEKAVPAHIVAAGKAKNLNARGGDRIAQEVYGYQGPRAVSTMYKVGLWFGPTAEAPDDADHQNHEAVVITDAGHAVLLFEPNFGFYHAKDDTATHKNVFEAAVRDLYDGNSHAENFHYRTARAVR